jgi:uncharacterized membrane protein HdeD (DUF308 family)
MSKHRITFSSWSSTALGVLLIAAGLLAIALPLLAGLAASTVVAWMLYLGGIGHLLFAWSARRAGLVLWQVALGLLYCGVGGYLLVHPVAEISTLVLILACYLLAEGALELLLAFVVDPFPGRGWLFCDGVVTLVLGGLIWNAWPTDSEWMIGFFIGLSMLSSGVSRVALSSVVRADETSGTDRPIGAAGASAR